jgi:hypothetical protein
MNLRCERCGRLVYSASPRALVGKGVTCECGGGLVELDEPVPPELEDGPGAGTGPLSGA